MIESASGKVNQCILRNTGQYVNRVIIRARGLLTNDGDPFMYVQLPRFCNLAVSTSFCSEIYNHRALFHSGYHLKVFAQSR